MRFFNNHQSTKKQSQKQFFLHQTVKQWAIALMPFIVALSIVFTHSFAHAITVKLTASETTWHYAQLITAVEQGEVASVRMSSDRSMAIATTQTGEHITVPLQNDPLFLEMMQENQVDVSVLPADVKLSTHLATFGFPLDLFFFLFPLFVFVVSIGGTIIWIWALIECVTTEPDDGNNKLIWVLIIVLANAIGGLIYLLVRRPQRIRELGR